MDEFIYKLTVKYSGRFCTKAIAFEIFLSFFSLQSMKLMENHKLMNLLTAFDYHAFWMSSNLNFLSLNSTKSN